jgi:hypothetical protein
MAAPPTITENNALFLAQQETRKRSKSSSLKFLRLLGGVWAAMKILTSERFRWGEKGTVAVLYSPPLEASSAGKIVTVRRTIRHPRLTS